ncbi:MAG: conjugal transfer protein TraN [Nitrospinae bacterium]|nr:conjugal transfer protein TraN [Nitrospinota bacterium]
MNRNLWLRTITLFLLAHLSITNALAEDPKAAARAMGDAGRSAAAAVARDPASSSGVPGYAGTDRPERDLGAADLGNAAARALADPGDPGGRAGRTVIEGTTMRPEASVGTGDPIPVRGEAIQGDPGASRFGASGLASGSVSDCASSLDRAESGGACGGVRWCAGADCGTTSSQANTGFVGAAAKLNMVLELGGEEFDRGNLLFFRGERRACRIRWGGLANCCKDSGLLIGLGNCTEAERLLAQERHAGKTHYLGTRCAKRILGVCVRRERVWCVFGSKLGRILQEAARAQLGIGWGSCRGFTVEEMERIDFEAVDLSEFTSNIMDGASEPSIALPDSGDTGSLMRERIRDFYTRNQ